MEPIKTRHISKHIELRFGRRLAGFELDDNGQIDWLTSAQPSADAPCTCSYAVPHS